MDKCQVSMSNPLMISSPPSSSSPSSSSSYCSIICIQSWNFYSSIEVNTLTNTRFRVFSSYNKMMLESKCSFTHTLWIIITFYIFTISINIYFMFSSNIRSISESSFTSIKTRAGQKIWFCQTAPLLHYSNPLKIRLSKFSF